MALGLLCLVASAAQASDFDRAMEPILTEYLKIQGALAADKMDGIKSAAETIEASAKALEPEKTAGDHADHFKSIPSGLVSACGKLKQAEDITAAREDFKALSKTVAMWVGMSKPKGTSVMYCPMVEAVWVQQGSEVSNPYFGPAMLGCGEKVGGAD
jgi:Cu(I)/Ag(I) efflux system membrane fusion protein